MAFKFPPFPLQAQSTSDDMDDYNGAPKLDDLPPLIHVKILSFVDLTDVRRYSLVCKLFYRHSDSQQVWKNQWIKFSQKTPFSFLPAASMTELGGVNFKDSCKRLWRVLISETCTFGGLNPVKCVCCREFTCTPACIEERRGFKVTIDIGGKITKIIRPDFRQDSHSTMLAIPKILKCYDCDKTFSREEVFNDSSSRFGGNFCQNLSVGSHTGLEFRSQALSSLGQDSDEPFCLFCDQDRTNHLLRELDVVVRTRQRMEGVRMQYFASLCEEDFRNRESFLPLTNGYCKDTSDILNAENFDLLSPYLALEHAEAFPIVKTFLCHLLIHHKLVDFMHRPNNALILPVPHRLPHSVKEEILKFLFEEAKASRICLLPKALAVAQLYKAKTCIVIDSGATSTSVSVVINGRIEDTRSQSINVGGWHVSQCLRQALDCNVITVSSLDIAAVKQKCRLSLNLSREHSVSETLPVKSQRQQHNGPEGYQKLEMTEITLSSELFLAPEMMYASLDLPARVAEAARNLPDTLVKECFSNIIITGGNTALRGFDKRFSRDLRELMPEHSPIINVRTDASGNHSWNTAYGAYAHPIPLPYENILNVDDPGRPLWMTREEYVTFGTQTMAINDHVLDEDG